MTYHKLKLRQDIINTLGRAIEPLTVEEIVHNVTNEGYKSQRCYMDDEILDVLRDLVTLEYVRENKNNTYEWIE